MVEILISRAFWGAVGLYILLGIAFTTPLVSGDVIDVPGLLYLPVVVVLVILWPIWLMVMISAALVVIVAGRG